MPDVPELELEVKGWASSLWEIILSRSLTPYEKPNHLAETRGTEYKKDRRSSFLTVCRAQRERDP